MRCGEVYCYICGDCIYCYENDPCTDGGCHDYEDDEYDPELEEKEENGTE